MKRIKSLLIVLIGILILPNVVNAASGSIRVSGSSTAVQGNSVTYTVTISSSTAIGSWQVDLNYDKSMLKLTSSTAESGGTYMVNSSNGTKSKSYSFTFKTLKTGTTSVKIGSYYVLAYEDMSSMSMSTSGKDLKIMTQAELEATYSSDASLKNITVDNYTLDPVFNSATYEYKVEVENSVDKVTVTGIKNDANATVEGGGEITLEEGDNKVELRVTAQKGNEQTYTVNVYRKELNPVEVSYNGKNYKIVRKAADLINSGTFTETTLTIDDVEVPALYSEITGITIVGVKDDNGDVSMYIYDDGIVGKYNELTSVQGNIIPESLKEDSLFSMYKKVTKEINGIDVECYQINKSSKQVIIYAMDTTTGSENFYLYDLRTDTYSIYRGEIDKLYQKQMNYYKYIMLGMLVLIIILLLIAIFKKGKPKKDKKKNKLDAIPEIPEDNTDDKEEVEEKSLEEEKEEKNKEFEEKEITEENMLEIPEELKEDDEVEVKKITSRALAREEKKVKKEQKKLIRDEMKRAKEEKKRKKGFDF